MATYTVRVKPGSRKGPLVQPGPDGELTVYVRERAIEGQANDAAIALLAKHFDVAKSRINVVRGHSSRVKHVTVD